MLIDSAVTHHARYRPERTALVWANGSWTYRQLDEQVNRCANVLAARGVTHGQLVGVASENSPWFLVALLATARLGGIFLPLNYRLSAGELAEILEDSGVRVLMAQPVYAERLGSETGILIEGNSGSAPAGSSESVDAGSGAVQNWVSLQSLLSAASSEPPRLRVHETDAVLLQYTSGSTGKPKGVLTDHAAWVQSCLIQSPLKRIFPQSVFLGSMPMCHMGGMKTSLEVLFPGATLIITNRFDAEAALDLIEEHQITNLAFVPTMFYQLLDAQVRRKRRLPSLRYINCGGAPLSEQRLRQAIDLFGCRFTQGYGMTEIGGGTITYLGPDEHVRDGVITSKIASVGRPMIDCDIKLVDDVGKLVPPGQPGEILVKTSRLFMRYWKPSQDAGPIDRDGYYHTRDIARRDEEGYLYILDRKQDMIISGGLNIFAREIEEVVLRHPAVDQTYVVGVPDELWGESVLAFVVHKDGMTCDEVDVQSWCRSHLASYKKPNRVIFLDKSELPVNWSGKVQKRMLRDRYMKHGVGLRAVASES